MELLKNALTINVVLFLMSLASSTATAQETTDRFFIEEGCTVQPGGARVYFTVSLDGTDNYYAYNLVINYPEGINIDMNGESPRVTMYKSTGTIYPYGIEEVENEDGDFVETKVYYHEVASNIVGNSLRIICWNAKNSLELTATEGKLLRIYFTASPYLKPGSLPLSFTEQKLVTQEEVSVVPTNYTSTAVTVGTESTLTLYVSATNKFSTCILPFDAEIPDGVEAYSCRSTNGEYLVLEKQTSFAAYTPYIIYAENGYEGTLSGTVDTSKYSETVTDGYLTGTVVKQELTAGNGNYVMQNQGDGAMFYKINDTSFVIPAGKCYLTLPAELQESAQFRIDGTTSIKEVKYENEKAKEIYDLTGRKLNNIDKAGIYIINGKKMLVK